MAADRPPTVNNDGLFFLMAAHEVVSERVRNTPALEALPEMLLLLADIERSLPTNRSSPDR